MKRPSPAEPVRELRSVPIVECGEELVDFLLHCSGLLLDRPRFEYRRETLLRRSVADRLCRASQALPPGYRLAVVEGWRAPHIQQRMYRTLYDRLEALHPDWSRAALIRTVNRYVAPINRRVPPPHVTGGAVDVLLATEQGRTLDHSSPWDSLDPQSFPLNAPGLSEEAALTRRILSQALTAGGLTNYPTEFWHWSYGDQGWAYRGGHPGAIYGPVEPPGWIPPADEMREEPLHPPEVDVREPSAI